MSEMGHSKKLMIIMLLTNPFNSDSRVYKEARSLVKSGHIVTIFAWDREGKYSRKEDIEGIKIRRIHLRAPYGLPFYLLFIIPILWAKMMFHLFSEDFDVVHCHDIDTLIPGYLAGKLKKKKVIYDAHEPLYYGHFHGPFKMITFAAGIIERYLCKRVDQVFVTSPYQFKKYKTYKVANVVEILNYPELTCFARNEEKRSNGMVIIGRIGRIEEHMGIEEIIESVKYLGKIKYNIKLMLLGSVYDNYRSKFDQLLFRGGKYVEYIRPVPCQDIPKYYQKMDISIMLYKNTENNREIYPIKLFESMAAGVPVIASNVGGTKNIIMKNKCGIIIDDPSQVKITGALKRLIDDGAARSEYGSNGRKAFEDEYNWGSEENKLINAYEGMIQAKA